MALATIVSILVRVAILWVVLLVQLGPARAEFVREFDRPAVSAYVKNLVGRANAEVLARGQPARVALVTLLANQQIPRGHLSRIVRNPLYANRLGRVLAELEILDGPSPSQSTEGLEILARELGNESDAARAERLVELLSALSRKGQVAIAPLGAWFEIRTLTERRGPSLFPADPEARRPATADYLNRLIERAPHTTRVLLAPGSQARADLFALLSSQKLRWNELSDLVRNSNLSHRLDAVLHTVRILDGTAGLRAVIRHVARATSTLRVERATYFLEMVSREPAHIVRLYGIKGHLACDRTGGRISMAVLEPDLGSALDALGEINLGSTDLEIQTTASIDAAALQTRLGGARSLQVRVAAMPVVDDTVAGLEERLQAKRKELQKAEGKLRDARSTLPGPRRSFLVRAVKRAEPSGQFRALSTHEQLRLLTEELSMVEADLALVRQRLGTKPARSVARVRPPRSPRLQRRR